MMENHDRSCAWPKGLCTCKPLFHRERDAERQAHAAAEFDEAAAMRRGGGRAGADLAADSILMVDAWLKALPERDRGSLLWVGRDEVQALHAGLERLSQQEDVIARLDREVEGHIELVVETQRSRDAALNREWKLREALMEGQRLFRQYSALNADLTGNWRLPFSVREWDEKVKALLAQPAAGEPSDA